MLGTGENWTDQRDAKRLAYLVTIYSRAPFQKLRSHTSVAEYDNM